jgi:hypothetical protein
MKRRTIIMIASIVTSVIALAVTSYMIYVRSMCTDGASEVSTNLSTIKLYEEAYKLVNGTYLDCATSPRLVPDENAVQWQDLGGGFTTMDFATSEKVRFIYGVFQATKTSFVAEALGDTDGDGNRILFVATESMSHHVIGSAPGDTDLILTLGTRNDTED